ncbi:hypothetical protein ABB02_01679 [Clostridiaceae bacterium JG1575]|nr:hypothetical protein ABB02_01679 [Clostridiaceae bacterium JG1575]
MTQKRSMTLRYSLLQALFWMMFGVVVAFGTLYLLSRGFGEAQIGGLMALANILGALLQPILGSFSDRTERFSLSQLLAGLAFLSLICAVSLPFCAGLITAVLYVLLISLAYLMMPLVNALGMYFVNRGHACDYGIARGIGSLFFALMSNVLGYAIVRYGAQFLPFVCGGFLTLILLFALLTPTQPSSLEPLEILEEPVALASTSLRDMAKRYPGFLWVLLGVLLIFSFHNLSNTYLIQIVRRLGGNEEAMGRILSLAALLELPAMLTFTIYARRCGAQKVMALSGVFWIVKASAYVLAQSMGALYGAQIFQGLSFAPFMPALVYFSNATMRGKDQVKGQALMTTANTLGGVFGNLFGGLLLAQAGVAPMLGSGLAMAALGALSLWFGLWRQKTATVQRAA